MPKKNHAEIICILDRSGSMESIAEDAMGGFNSFIEDQKKVPGTASVSLVLFDHEYLNVYENKNINDVQKLTEETFVPRGMTALLDAVGRTINTVGERLSKTPEEDRPEKVMVCILTDGFENKSKEFTKDKIKEMITHQREKYSWEFSYVGANVDAFAEAGAMGISQVYTASFLSTGEGTREAYKSLNKMSSSYRTGNV
jgi:uncharacterized protein YegL